jgi:hypothetical protein
MAKEVLTGKEIRDVGFLRWKDPWAWMETMRGKRWETLIHQEKRHFNELASQAHVKKETRQMQEELEDARQYLEFETFQIGCGTIDIFIMPTSRFYWKWSWSKKRIPAYDIDVQGNIVWYVTSEEDKNYKNRLICEDATGTVIWTKSAVSSQIAIINQYCYYVKVADYFNTVELCVCHAQTGKNERILYKEKNKENDLQLIKSANRTLYFQSSNPVKSSLYRIKELVFVPLFKNSVRQIPLGQSIYGEDCVLVKTAISRAWEPHGKPISQWTLPKEEIQWVNLESGHVLTIHEGAQTLWVCHPKPHLLFKIRAGSIYPNQWLLWENTLIESFLIKSPFQIPYTIRVINDKVIRHNMAASIASITRPVSFKPLEIHRFHTASKDGTKVPFFIIKEKGVKPKAQLIYVYGAYGSSTPIDWPYQNWYPLLKRKWAIVFALVRGGGDVDEAWADAARRENRHRSVDDFEAVIRSAQEKNHLHQEQTVIYGRSAGGLPVGAIVSRFPDGELVGAAFTEVPYVDVLRTSSNPELPLTVGEYKEFGEPAHKVLNFKELLSVSPINTLPADGAPGVFVMSRVGLLDRQVFAYESFKWIQKLRGASSLEERDASHPKGKYVTFEKEEGHQYRYETFPKFRAIDLAILNSWVDQRL